MMVYMKLKKFQNKENLNNRFKIKDQIVIMNQYFQKLVFLQKLGKILDRKLE